MQPQPKPARNGPPAAKGTVVYAALATILGLFLVGAGLRELSRARRAQASLAAADQRYEAGQQQLNAAVKSAQAADRYLADLQKAADGSGRAGSAAANPRVNRPPPETRADWEALEAQHPEIRGMLAEVHRAQVGRQFGRFFQQAGLTADQVERFVNLAVDLYDRSETMSPQGFHPAIDKLPDDQVQAIVGDQAFRQYQDYLRATPANFIVGALAQATGYVGAPLSNAQQDSLAGILTASSQKYQDGGAVDLTALDWANVEKQTQSLLSPDQWEAAKANFLGYQYQLALLAARQSANAAAGSGGGRN